MIQKINLKIILTVIFIIIGAYLIFEHCCESDIQNIPVGIKIESISSPDKNYMMNVFFIDGGPISADAIRVEIQNENGETRNIYYSYPTSSVDAIWIDNDNVKINHIRLNIHKDSYKKIN